MVTHKIGKKRGVKNSLSNWRDAIGKNVSIKTMRGRPIFGKLLAMDANQLTISARYMSGNATLTVLRKDVLSVALSR